MKAVGILGGTFDPIHIGHLRLAQEITNAVGLGEVRFIPSATPPHRQPPVLSAELRAALVKLAIADNPAFMLDERELQREGPSFTIDTLKSLREELGSQVSLSLMMGADAFLGLPDWHEWESLLDYAHLVVAHRPHAELQPEKMSPALHTLYNKRRTANSSAVAKNSGGLIYVQAITALDISATDIRQSLKAGKSPRYLMPDSVLDHLLKYQLYR